MSLSSNEDNITVSRQSIGSSTKKVTVWSFRLSLVMNWDGISVEENALAAVVNQASERYAESSNYKDNEMGESG